VTEKEFLENINNCKGIISKLVSLYANDEDDKKDYTQEIIYQAWKSSKNFKGESKFSSWLYRLALNTLIVLSRNKNIVRRVEDLSVYEKHYQTSPNSDAEILYLAIKSLENTDKAIITMHLDGYSNDEIAEYLGVNSNNLTVKLHRIKEKIKKMCHGIK
jgi:RNA polymerase sigma-70 factor, ECF subfamily